MIADQKILYLDTTHPTLMMALGVDGTLKAIHRGPATSQRYHSAILVPSIQQLLAAAALTAADLTALAVNTGPGSFTGIRTGLVTIRTMAQFLEIPVYTFNTFELLAVDAGRSATVLLDALQGNVYAADVRIEHGLPVVERQGLFSAQGFEPAYPPALAYPRLAAKLEALPVEAVDEAALLTPKAMQHLLQGDLNRHATPWREVKPLYLQAPNITVKACRVG